MHPNRTQRSHHPLGQRIRKLLRLGSKHDRCCCPNPCSSLDQCQSGDHALVTGNPDKKTRELGMFCGVMIDIIKNDDGNANMIIGVGDARYAISKKVAKLICVKVNREDSAHDS